MSQRVIVLAVLVLIVGGFLLFRELPVLESERDRAMSDLLLFRDAPAVVDTLRIAQAERTILVVRDGERWFLRSPVDEEIPAPQIEELIVRLRVVERWRRVARDVPDGEWDEFGLGPDSPGRVRIEIIGPDGRSAVDVGLLTSGSHTVWTRRVGTNDLDVCFSDLYDLANATHQGLRNPRLFPVAHDELTRMEFEAGGNSWSAVRGEDGLWFLGSADGPRLKRWVLEDIAFAVAGLRVDGYLRDSLTEEAWAAYGLDQPWATARWEATGGRSGTLWLGNELGNGVVFGRREGLDTVFQIGVGLEPAFNADPDEWIDRNPIGGNFLRSTKIRVHLDEGFIDIIRETPGARVETDQGPVEGGDYVQVTARNLQLGVEEFQPLAEMIVPAGKSPADALEVVEARMTIHWPDRVADFAIGRLAGRNWIAFGDTLYEAPTDFLLRVREVLELR